jgi:uncharacterized protein (TIGR02145 family)
MMKTKSLVCIFILQVFLFAFGCKKEKANSLPEISTTPLSDITSESASSGGTITSDGGSPITSRGVCWSQNFDPTISDNFTSDGTGAGAFSSSMTGLKGGTYYYLRAYATNKIGIAYGNEFNFILPVSDADGNLYSTIIIGGQIWMATNLETSKFNDNTDIQHVVENTNWSSLSTPAFCWYNNLENLNNNYGALYNWFSVNTGKLCPVGWHVPTEDDWITLTNLLGGELIAGGKLKEAGTLHWMSPNTSATNDFRFTALPTGYRTGLDAGTFRATGYLGFFWAGTEEDSVAGRARMLSFESNELAPGAGLKKNGYSVRCVKD